MNASRTMLCLVVIVFTTSALRAQEIAPGAAKGDDLRQSLVGAWVLVGRPGDTAEPPADAEMKFIGLGHFAVTKRNAETGKIDYHHVGTYTLEGDQYAETVTFATGATESLAGQTFRFKIQVNGDIYLQYGQGNPWTQQWKRLTK